MFLFLIKMKKKIIQVHFIDFIIQREVIQLYGHSYFFHQISTCNFYSSKLIRERSHQMKSK